MVVEGRRRIGGSLLIVVAREGRGVVGVRLAMFAVVAEAVLCGWEVVDRSAVECRLLLERLECMKEVLAEVALLVLAAQRIREYLGAIVPEAEMVVVLH